GRGDRLATKLARHPELARACLVAPSGEAQHADEQPLGPFADGAGQRAVATDGGPELAAQPLLELLEVGEREGLDLDRRDVVVAAAAAGSDLRPVRALDGGARGGEGGEPAHGLRAGAGPHEEPLLER